MRLGIDARPLRYPHTGIGRYLTSLLPYFDSEFELHLYFAGEAGAVPALAGSVAIRETPINGRATASLVAQAVFPVWAKRDRLDVFWSPRHHLPLLLGEIPSVLTVHDMVWRNAPQTMTRLGRWLEQGLMPPSLKKAQKIFCISEATAADVRTYAPDVSDRVLVTPLAPFNSVGPRSTVDAPYALFVGTIEPRKNFLRVYRAFEKLHAAGQLRYRLHVVGGAGWQCEQEMALLRDVSAPPWLSYLGQIDDAALEQQYAGAQLLVCPSLYEGFGLPIVEAMKYGVPVLTSNVSAMPEIAGDGGLKVDPLSVDEIALNLTEFASDPELRLRLSEGARIQVAQFSWQKTAALTLEGIRSVNGLT